MVKTLLLLSTFVSALLLFIVQPLYAKYLLPFFGGTSSVWTISVFFYSTTLLVGYIYASFLTSWPERQGRVVHTLLLLAAGLMMFFRWLAEGSPLLVGAVSHSFPSISVLLTLSLGVGLPVLLLASTSIITQHLFARLTSEEPYHLFALSNAGSLLALLIYPFVFERYVDLSLQSSGWFFGFWLFGVILSVAWFRVKGSESSEVIKSEIINTVLNNKLKIVLLAAIPTFMLASTTELMSRGIASFPLLWVIPLALYLISLIVAFAGMKSLTSKVPLGFWVLISIIPVFGLIPIMNMHSVSYWLAFVYTMIALYFVSLYFHSQVYKLRPRVKDLGSFYVLITFGGALGSGVVGMVLPVILNSQIEVPIAFALLAVYFSFNYLGWLSEKITRLFVVIIQAMVVLLALYFTYSTTLYTGEIFSLRNFYGTIKVIETEKMVYGESVDIRMIVNGSTNHGLQALGKQYKESAASYYGPNSGIDIAIRSFTENEISPKINVIGLGIGMMSAYCDDVESIHYIEINPAVEEIARDYFTYLESCGSKNSVEIADGRLALEKGIESSKIAPFDVLMVDAFTDDAIPSHLLTTEAFSKAYRPVLAEDGIVAFHISNKYLNLAMPIAGMAKDNGFEAVVVENVPGEENGLYYPTVWILVASKDRAEKLVDGFENARKYEGEEVVWTDQKNSVLDVLSINGSATAQ